MSIEHVTAMRLDRVVELDSLDVLCLQGRYTVLASEPYLLCGIDVAAPQLQAAANAGQAPCLVADRLQRFKATLAASEVRAHIDQGSGNMLSLLE